MIDPAGPGHADQHVRNEPPLRRPDARLVDTITPHRQSSDKVAASRPMPAPSQGHDALEDFTEYVESIHQLVQPPDLIPVVEWRSQLAQCLDGGPNRVLRSQPEQSDLKQQGAYFTSARLALRVANTALTRSAKTLYYDPACGAGDLLIAIARKLPLTGTFQDTLQDWGARLAGCDISADFVRLAKTRLALLAAKRCRLSPPFDLPTASQWFPRIVVADSLSDARRTPKVDVVVMNPPFGYVSAPATCDWASGRVNAAALFATRAIRDARPGSRIVAILPDVLRSGTRYIAWRDSIRASGTVLAQRSLGLFDPWADVDVYLLHFKKTPSKPPSKRRPPTSAPKGGIGKRFHVHVGSVVPHRHPEEGSPVPYLHARSIPGWKESSDIPETRKFNGRLFQPPFVTIRRTSRPDDGKRAVATVILGDDPVAVENHLIVCLPKDGTADACRALMRRLRSLKTDNWLNKHLRCRHLTTRLIARIPWWYKP